MMWFPSVILSLWMVLNRNLSPTLTAQNVWRCSTSAKLLPTATSIEVIGQNAGCIKSKKVKKVKGALVFL